MTSTSVRTLDPQLDAVATRLVEFLRTGAAPDGLFAADMFCDLTIPTWRLQADDAAGAIGLRSMGHPWPGEVTTRRLDPIPGGFLIEVEERWLDGGDAWYCRELIRADVRDGAIVELSVYCTGDWDSARVAEHAAAVTLIRP